MAATLSMCARNAEGQTAAPVTPPTESTLSPTSTANPATAPAPPVAAEPTSAERDAKSAEATTAPAATAANTPPETPRSEWDPIVVTATRSARSTFDAPASVDTVTADDINDAQFRTLPDALRYVPGVMIQKTGHAQGSPYIRGFTGFRNLLLVDGIRLNNSVFRDGPNQYWSTVDPQSIDRLEVVKGPSSVLFGSDAIGGTVNVFTKGPTLGGETFQFGGRVYDRVSTAEQSNTIRGELSVSWDGSSGVYGGVTYANYGDLITASGAQPQTNYDELAGDFKLDLAVSEGAHIIVAQQSYDSDDAWRTHRTIYAQSFAGTAIGNERERSLDQDRSLSYIQFHSDGSGTDLDGAHLSLSYGNQSEEEDRTAFNRRRDVQSFSVDTIGLWGQLEASGVLGRWTTGFEFYHDDVDSSRTDFNANGSIRSIRIQGPIADDSTYDMAAVYVQNEIDATDWLEFITGARYTFVAVDAGRFENPTTATSTTLSDNYDSLVGSGRFVVHLDHEEHWNAFGGISQAFRAPNLSDLTRLDTARSNEIETPAPSLSPENYLSYEVGLKTEYEQFFAQASWFWTEVDGMIIRQPTGAIIDGNREVTKRNSGDGFIQGFETEANWRFTENFTLWGSLAWLDGEVDGYPTSAPVVVREPITRMMPLTTQVGLRWDSAKRNFWIEGVVLNAEDATELSASDRADTQRIPPGGTPGYTTLSLRSGYKLSHGVSMTAVLDNVTNEDYRVHGSGINEAGINFIFGLEWRF